MCAAASIHTMLLPGERIGDGAGLSRAGDVREIGRRQTAPTAHHVTRTALPLAPEHLFTVRNVAGERVVDRGPAQRVNIGDQLPDVGLRQALGRHRRARDAVLDDVERLRVRYPDIEAVAGHGPRGHVAPPTARAAAAPGMPGVPSLPLRKPPRAAAGRIYRARW